MFVLIDTNEQGLAEVILAVFRLGGEGTGLFAELIANRLKLII